MELFYGSDRSLNNIYKKLLHGYNLKAQLMELFKDCGVSVELKIKEQTKRVVAIVPEIILICFMQVLSKNIKCRCLQRVYESI